MEDYRNHDEFVSKIEAMEKASVWTETKLGQIRITMSGGACPLALEAGFDTTPLTPWAMDSLEQLLRDNPGIFSVLLEKGQTEEVVRRLEVDRVLLQNKKVIFLKRKGVISGLFSQFNHNWDENQQIQALEEHLSSFCDWRFAGGSISLQQTKAMYRLAEDCGPYLASIQKQGLDSSLLAGAIPTLEFNTGESGLTQITLIPKISLNDQDMILGTPLKTNHRGSDEKVWGKFMENLAQVGALFEEGLVNLTRLSEVKILHPYYALTHILAMFASSVPLEDAKFSAEVFSISYPPADLGLTCTAYDLYKEVNEIVSGCAETVGIGKALCNVELLARLMKMDWKKFDKPVPAPLGRSRA